MYLLTKIFYIVPLFLSSLVSTTPLSCISIKNQECKVRPEIININSNNPIFYPFSIKINECSGDCNNIKNPYAKICIPDVFKNLNVKVFNLLSRTDETRNIKWHKTCKCICRLDGIICNSKQRWNKDKCRCECKELIDKGVCNKGFIWNPSNCECECDKSYNIGEYLDYSNCKCRNKLTDPLVEECTENIEETKLVKKALDENKDRCNSYVIYKALFWTFFIFFIINFGIGIYFVYDHYVNHNKFELPYFNDIIDSKDFQSNLLKIDKKQYKDIDIDYIGYITIKKFGDCENIHSVNPLYLIIHSATGYFKEKNVEKYLMLDSTEKYEEVFSGIKKEIETINSGKELIYEKRLC